MRGWAMEFEPGGRWIDSSEFGNEVIGFVADANFPEPELILQTAQRVPPGSCVVVRENDTLSREALDAAGCEYVVASLNPYWKRTEELPIHGPLLPGARRKIDRQVIYDFRSKMRVQEMLYGCTTIMLFKDAKSEASSGDFVVEVSPRAKTYVIERGKKKTRARKGRKVEA